MEKKTIGTFLSALRKANGMTQQEVADKLNVSNKTVSKWERDEGCPEIMMLPAIAELYSVTVDEILRGERTTKTSHEEYKNTKSEERIKYLIGKASTKFTNSSIISIILGAVALILTYTIGEIVYNYNFLWVGYVIILVLAAASVSVVLVAFNNLISGLRNEDIVEKECLSSTMKICVRYITVVAFLSVVTLLGLIISIINNPSFLFVALPPTAIVGGITAYLIRSFLYKRYDIAELELSYEQKKYRKRHIKTTAIILSVVIFISVLSPFIGAFIDTLSISSYCFADGVNYQYDTIEEAENEYYKLKSYVIGEETLYNICDEYYNEEADTYTLYINEFFHIFEKGKKGYNLTETGVSVNSDTTERIFNSYEEMEKFKTENTYNEEYLSIDSLQKNVNFDDKTLTVSYQYNTDYLTGAFDIFPVFILFGSCICIIIFVVSVVVYYRKKKKLAEHN